MSTCPMCGQEEPVNTEHARLMRARHAVMDAWKAGSYADKLNEAFRGMRWMDVVDDAIAAVRDADAESDKLAADLASPTPAGETR